MSILATATVRNQHRLDRIGTVDIRGIADETHSELLGIAQEIQHLVEDEVAESRAEFPNPAPTSRTYVSTSAGCPAWCRGGHGDEPDNTLFHTSPWTLLDVHAGPETSAVAVSVERLDIPGSPLDVANVRIEGHGPMTAVEALHLAAAIQAAAFTALLDDRQDTADTRRWAHGIVGQPVQHVAEAHGMSVGEATRLQLVVADLLDQAAAQ